MITGLLNRILQTPRRARAASISSSHLMEALASGWKPVLLDIRAVDTYASGHLPGAVNIPLAVLQDAAGALDHHRPVVVY